MGIRNTLRNRLYDHSLSFTWLINVLRLHGLEVDKTTLSSAFSGTITGPRVSKIMDSTAEILDEYDKFVQAISV